MEKSISLTHAEVAALLDMSLLTYAKVDEEVARSALCKLGNLCREFDLEEKEDGANLEAAAKV